MEELLLRIPGLGENIFSQLDNKSLADCKKVSKVIKNLHPSESFRNMLLTMMKIGKKQLQRPVQIQSRSLLLQLKNSLFLTQKEFQSSKKGSQMNFSHSILWQNLAQEPCLNTLLKRTEMKMCQQKRGGHHYTMLL